MAGSLRGSFGAGAKAAQMLWLAIARNGHGELDLRELGAQNRQFADRLRAASVLASIFDSRRRILRPKFLVLRMQPNLWADGTLVEIDGAAGVIGVLEAVMATPPLV